MSKQYVTEASADTWIEARALRTFCADVFVDAGLPADAAATVADNLVVADLRGVHSHGVTRMEIYTERLRRGLFNPHPRITIDRTGAAACTIDGDNGMGAVVGTAAIGEAIEMAAATGLGAVTVRHSNHFGTTAYYIAKAVARGMFAFVCSNAPPTMAVWGGREPLFGTNPLGYGMPTGRYPAIVADLATSIVARGKILLAAQRGEMIPPGWALDPEGAPTTDPHAALIGAVLPFGEYKGSAFAMLVELLAGRLSGANSLQEVPDFYRDLKRVSNFGHFFLCLDVARFMDMDRFRARVDDMITTLKASKRAAGHAEVLMPGEIETRLQDERLRSGIPLTAEIVRLLETLAARHGVAFPAVSHRPLAAAEAVP
ncbi:Ldh family oxidoreductase [Rhodoplanes elegans]|nr:Ldh family oxidoreductase [Rhodoplanes elegans]